MRGNQALNWNRSSMNRKPGRPQKNWHDIIRRDLKDIGLTWDEVSKRHIPEAAGVNVWPNVSLTPDELRSQVRSVLNVHSNGTYG